jgi:hypothetical protein
MERKIVQDIMPPRPRITTIKKEKTRHIPVRKADDEPALTARRKGGDEDPPEPPRPPQQPRQGKPSRGTPSRFKKYIVSGVVVLSILVLFFAISLIYSSATVKVSPKIQAVSVDGAYTAKKDAKADELQYELMTITKQKSATVTASGSEHVSKKAKGRVILYNNYSKDPQKLLVGTRIENTKGLIYKIDTAVTIPGLKVVSGVALPGSVEVSMTASEPGDKYNMKVTDLAGDFRIVGFKGDPKYEKFYGRLKTDVTGGLVGIEKKVDPATAATARNALRQSLLKEMIADAKAQVPADFIMFDNAYTISYQPLDNSQGAGNDVTLNEKGIFTAVLFKRDALARFTAPKEIQKFKGNAKPDKLEDLDFKISNLANFRPADGMPLSFTLKGVFRLIGTFSSKDLRENLVNKRLDEVNSVLSKYGTINSADVILRPFWRRTFPDTADRINVEIIVK